MKKIFKIAILAASISAPAFADWDVEFAGSASAYSFDRSVTTTDNSQSPAVNTIVSKSGFLQDFGARISANYLVAEDVYVGISTGVQYDLEFAGDVSKQIIRWSFKGMMQIHHLLQTHSEFDFIIYIDADTVFTTASLFATSTTSKFRFEFFKISVEFFNSFSSISHNLTLAPFAKNFLAISKPNPWAPPVIIAVLSFKSNLFIFF